MTISAIAFIGKDITQKHRVLLKGVIYTLGRAFTCTVIGLLFFFGLGEAGLKGFFQVWGEKILGPVLIIIGVFREAIDATLDLSQWYAHEHVVMCLLPAFLIAGAPTSSGCGCGCSCSDNPEVLYCPWRELTDYLEQLPKDREIIVADSSGASSRTVVNLLTEKGFPGVGILAGGMVEWERSTMPILLNNKARLSGSCMCQLKFRTTQ